MGAAARARREPGAGARARSRATARDRASAPLRAAAHARPPRAAAARLLRGRAQLFARALAAVVGAVQAALRLSGVLPADGEGAERGAHRGAGARLGVEREHAVWRCVALGGRALGGAVGRSPVSLLCALAFCAGLAACPYVIVAVGASDEALAAAIPASAIAELRLAARSAGGRRALRTAAARAADGSCPIAAPAECASAAAELAELSETLARARALHRALAAEVAELGQLLRD